MLDRQLSENRYVAGDFLSIADMAIWPWAQNWKGQDQIINDKPHFARWLAELAARPGFVTGKAIAEDRRSNAAMDKRAQEILFKR